MSWNKAPLKDTTSPHGLREMPLQELADRIVRQGERESLEELVERRPLFRRGPVNGLLLADYVHDLWRRPPFGCSGDATSVLDKAHDITLDKFTRLHWRRRKSR